MRPILLALLLSSCSPAVAGGGVVDVHIVDPHIAEPEPGAQVIPELLVPGSQTLMAWVEIRHHFGQQGIDSTSPRLTLAQGDTLIVVARQQGQTQAGFDSVAASMLGAWYTQRPAVVKERIWLGFKMKTPPPQ